jgi:hypothetical protein
MSAMAIGIGILVALSVALLGFALSSDPQLWAMVRAAGATWKTWPKWAKVVSVIGAMAVLGGVLPQPPDQRQTSAATTMAAQQPGSALNQSGSGEASAPFDCDGTKQWVDQLSAAIVAVRAQEQADPSSLTYSDRYKLSQAETMETIARDKYEEHHCDQ